jgi:hypothetical protein
VLEERILERLARVKLALLERHERHERLTLQIVGPTHHGGLGDERCATSALSISAVPRRWPATFTTSSTRPITQK